MTQKPMAFSTAQSRLKRVLAQGLLSKVKKQPHDKDKKKEGGKDGKSQQRSVIR